MNKMIQSTRKQALISGISLIIMAIAAGFAYGYVQSNLVVAGDAQTTAANLNQAKTLFGAGVLAWFIILICDLLVAWNLYKFFAAADRKVSVATGILRGLYSAILAFAIYQLAVAWHLLYAPNPDAQMLMGLVDAFNTIWSLGLIVFGLHLLGLAYLSLRTTAVPNWLGWLLYLAGTSYTIIHAAKAVAHGGSDTIAMAEMILSLPMAVAELGLAVWLIWKGGKEIRNDMY